MKITVVGSGDAFATGGRAHTCFRVDSAPPARLSISARARSNSWKKLGLSFDSVDAVAISHLHGDHFGGLPFLLLDCQFVGRRTRPLLLMGPPGLRDRIHDALELFFPGVGKRNWSFAWRVEEVVPGKAVKLGAFSLESFGVIHSAASISTGLRLSDGRCVFAYSGDTAWTETLFEIGAGADLFACECSSGDEPVPEHLDWPTLKAKLPGFSAKRMVVTHMGASALARRADMELAGVTVAYDGQIFDL